MNMQIINQSPKCFCPLSFNNHISKTFRMRHRAFLFLLFSILFQVNDSSYCGANGVPYSLEILSDGSPVLGCAQPTCMAEPSDDYEDSTFIANAAGQEDGFFREGDRQRKSYSQSFKPKAECPGTFSDLACTKKNQWVGGIDFIDHPRQPLILQCCTFEGLRFSQDVGVTTISTGEAVTGGEVIREGRQISFDVIANVRRLVDPDDPKRTYYEVTVRRMNCLPDPQEFEVEYDDDVESEIDRVLGNATNSAMSFGHENHPHMAQEKKISKRPYKRKPKTSSTHNVISPISGQEDHEKKGRSEPFIGSFGAPIFNPTAEDNSWKPEEAETVKPTRHTHAYTRRIVTPKPRVTKTTEAPTTTTPPPVHVQIEPQQPQPAPLNPFEFHPLPPFPQFGLPQPNPFVLPQFGAPPAAPPAHHVFGVPQSPLAPLPPPQPAPPPPPPPQQFGLFAPPTHFGMPAAYGLNANPIQPPAYGIVAPQNEHFNNLDVYTKALLTNPNSPFVLQMPQLGAPPSPQYGIPQQQVQQLPSQTREQPLQRVKIDAPQREPPNVQSQDHQEPIYQYPVQSADNLGPSNSQLGQLYQPPPFSALGTTLYNFQSHNGKR